MSDEGGKGKYAVLAVIVIAAVLGWPYLSWFRLEMDIRDAFGDKQLGRFPDAGKIVDFQSKLSALAKARGFDDATVQVSLEARQMGPTTWYFVKANVASGGHAFLHERRIETKLSDDDLETLSEGGVGVPK